MEEEENAHDDTPTIPQNASILQCLKGVINIFETAAAVDFQIIDRESMILLFEDQREQRLLCDVNVLRVLHAMYELCENDEAILRKLHTWSVFGTKRKVERGGTEETTNHDENEAKNDVIEID